jgi:Tfp pilus tip-associated adhesin PilY1
MGITPVHFLYVDEGTRLHAKEFFTGDSEGNVLHCDMTRPVGEWKLKSIFRLRTEEDKPIALPLGYLIAGDRRGSDRWLFGGTANVTGPGQDRIQMPGGVIINQQKGLRNGEQYIFGLHMKNPKAETKTDLSYDNIPDPVTLKDLTSLKYLKTTPDGVYLPSWSEETAGEQVEKVGPDGWKLRLRPKINTTGTTVYPTEAEYVTADPFIHNGVLYVATFIPFTEQPTEQERCRDIGVSKLYALEPGTGASMWAGGAQSYVFKNIKIVGVSAAGNKLFMGIKALMTEAEVARETELNRYEETRNHKPYAGGSVVEIGTAAEGEKMSSDPIFDSPQQRQQIQYWREIF